MVDPWRAMVEPETQSPHVICRDGTYTWISKDRSTACDLIMVSMWHNPNKGGGVLIHIMDEQLLSLSLYLIKISLFTQIYLHYTSPNCGAGLQIQTENIPFQQTQSRLLLCPLPTSLLQYY